MKLSQQQFERLALEQMDTVYRVARRLARREDRAEDLVQETYLRALRAKDSFKLEEYGIRPWLLRILYNLHVSKGQRDGRRPIAMDDEHLQMIEQGSNGDALPIDPASFEGMDQRLVRAIESLPPEYQAVMLMWAVEELSYKEMAHVLDVPIGTVMSRLHRARQRLADQLRDLAVEGRLIRE
jgi:RNA polymerase sigma-70 factor (ECF subfamily)